MHAPSPTATSRRRVLIVDDHPLLREGLGKVIEQQPDLELCGNVSDGPEAFASLRNRRPDIVIVDLSLENGSGLELIKDLHALYPKLPMLALSMHHENVYAERVLHAGARGYVMKRQSIDVVLDALRKILAGQLAVSQNIVSRILGHSMRGGDREAADPVDQLSDRELEIYRLLGEGQGTRAIAVRLRLAVSTVESFRNTIKHKLNLANATELVASATRFVTAETAS